jgi:DNA processing protein
MQYIIELGTVISVFPFVTKPEGGNFPQRNRIISGLSHGTIIVEARA